MILRVSSGLSIARQPLPQLLRNCSKALRMARFSDTALPTKSDLLHLPRDKSPGPKLYRWTLANLANNSSPHNSREQLPRKCSNGAQRIYVLGLGNVGRLFATSLAKLSNRPPITLVVHRESLLEHWRSSPGVEMTRAGIADLAVDFDIEMWLEKPPPAGPVREIADGGIIPNIIVATKAPDALPQVDKLRRYLGPTSSVVFTQNGVNRLWSPSGIAYVQERFGGQHPNFLACVVTHGVTSSGAFRSVHASPADVVVGAVLPNDKTSDEAAYVVKQIVDAPYLAGRRVSRPELFMLQLEKLVVNAIINPLTAVLRCRNGYLFTEPGGEVDRVMDLLLKEASGVLQRLAEQESTKALLAAGASTDKVGTAPVERFSFPRLRSMLHRVGDKVRDNTSSMLQDVRAGKSTEIGEFNGWFVETASQLGGDLDVRSHKILVDLVEQGVVLDKARLGNSFSVVDQ